MAISPDYFKEQIESNIKKAEESIDKQLKTKHIDVDGAFKCYIDRLSTFEKEEIAKRYKAVGWDSVSFNSEPDRQGSSYYIELRSTFKKDKPSSQYDSLNYQSYWKQN
jgi:hypothetical protein